MIQMLLSELWPYLAAAAGVIAGLFYARQSGKAAGRSSQKSKQKKERLDSIEKSNEIEKQHDQKPIDDVRDNSAKWVRGNKR